MRFIHGSCVPINAQELFSSPNLRFDIRITISASINSIVNLPAPPVRRMFRGMKSLASSGTNDELIIATRYQYSGDSLLRMRRFEGLVRN